MRHIATRRHTSLCALTAVASLLLAAPISARAESLFVSGQDSSGNGVVLQYSPTGADLGTFASVGPGAALGLAFTGGGDLLVANNFNGTNIGNTIHEFSPTGADLGVFASTGMDDPQGLAINTTSGDVFVANHGDGTIHEFSPTGADLGTFANLGFNGLGPIGLGFNSSGDLYVSDSDPSFTESFIFELSPTGTVLPGSFLGGSSRGLAVNAGGNVFVSDVSRSGSGQVYEFTPTLAVGTPFGGVLNSPYGLAFNSSGDLFAADGDNTINEFSPTGADLGTFASTGTVAVSPFFLAFGPASAAPLPSSVWTGLALLSGLGLVQLSRRKSVLTA